MPRTRHGFCGLHFIAYDRSLDPHCPQCVIGRTFPTKQYDFDEATQKPLDAGGKPVELDAVQAS